MIWLGKRQALTTMNGLSGMLLASAILCSVILAPALCGCASPGFPRPPSLHLPEPVTDLTATRIANRVELHWTAPTRTTDGLDLTIPTTVEICRDDAARQALANSGPPCTAVLKAAGHPGPSAAVDYLPASLSSAQAQPALMAYRVRVLNPSGRAAAPSSPILVPSGASPPPVEGFRAVQQKDGVLLAWHNRPRESDAAVEVLRTDLAPRTPAGPAPRTGPPATPKTPNPFAARRKAASSAEVLLRADAASSPYPAPDGMIDQTASRDGTYTYQARRVLSVSVDGKSFVLFSEQSGPLTVAMRDTFPPEAPQGLLSIPGVTAPPSQAGSRPTIDLSWQPNTEVDLAGYLVDRTDLGAGGGAVAGAAPVRLTPSPIAGSAFRDSAVMPRHRYVYRVIAVDSKGNKSAPSAPVEDSPEGR